MSQLLDDLNSVSRTNYECAVGQLLKALPKNEATELSKVIDKPDTSATLLSRVLLNHGYIVHRKTITRHRLRGTKETGCACK